MKARIAKGGFALLWLFLFYQLLFNPNVREPLYNFCIGHPFLAPLLLVIMQLFLATFGLPCSPLSILAGVLWGLYFGILYSTLATVISSIWTFFIGRHFLIDWIKINSAAGWWLRISRLIERYNWKASMMAHANPIFPGSSLGYIFGASTIAFKPFLFGVVMGTMPLQFLTVILGSIVGNNISNFNINTILGLIVVFTVLVAYKILAPKILNRFGGNDGEEA